MWSTRGVTPRLRPRALLLALPALLVPAACSDDDPDDPISDQVAAAVARDLEISASEVQASCPSSAEAETGAQFTCDAHVDGQRVEVAVAFTAEDAFTVDVDAAVLPKDVMEAEVKAELVRRFQGVDVTTVDCGGEDLVVIPAGTTVDCHAEDSTGAKATAVIGLDAEGKAVVQTVTDPNAPVPT